MRAGGGDGLPGVALVADPDVAVVVVAAGLGPFRAGWWWRRRPCRRRRGQPAQHRVGVAGIPRFQAVGQVGNGCGPGGLGRFPGGVRVRWLIGQGLVADLQDQVVVSAGRYPQARDQAVVPVDGAGVAGAAGPAQVQRAAAAGPGSVRVVQVG